MEKLVLRGIMYGADKIPDSWFEKVPGGFYKSKAEERREHEKDEKRRSRRERSRRRRHSDEHEERRRRHDDAFYDDNRPPRASERRRRDARSRSSYDGGADYDPEEDERDRRRSRRRTYADDDWYGYDDGFSQPSSTRHSYAPNGRPNDFSSIGSQRPSQHPDQDSNSRSKRHAAAAAAAGAGTAAAMAQQTQRHTSTVSPMNPPTAAAPEQPAAVPVVPSYVPYSNIYGPSASQSPAARGMFSPPPPQPASSTTSSVKPNSVNQVGPFVPPVANPYDYPPAGTTYDSRGFPDPYHTTYARQQDPYQFSRSPSPSLDSTATPPRRARSERRPNREKERPRGKSLSRLQEKLGISQQSLGYSAVGAVAGGLVGSGIGKGRMPAAIGAAIGGIGANALGANQRFVDPRFNLNNGAPLPPPPPDPPSGARSSNNSSRQQMSRRRDDRRTSEWALDQDLISRREARERARREADAEARGNRSE